MFATGCSCAHHDGDGQPSRREALVQPFSQLQELVRVLQKLGHHKAGDRVQAAADEWAEQAVAKKLEFKVEIATPTKRSVFASC